MEGKAKGTREQGWAEFLSPLVASRMLVAEIAQIGRARGAQN